MRRWDYVIAAVILALCAFAVERQISAHGGGGETPIRRIEVGEVLEPDWVLEDLSGKNREVAAWFGSKATVLYSWKSDCPCVDVVEGRLRHLFVDYGPARGVNWIAVDGESEDSPGVVLEKMGRLQSFYRMLMDPEQRLSARVGFQRATVVAVFDASGRLRYRGSIDDSYESPQRSYLKEALEAVLGGGDPPTPETESIYGCEYSGPPSCPVEGGGVGS